MNGVPSAATCFVIDSMNGAVGSPSYRGYDDVSARMFMPTPTARRGSAQDLLDDLLDPLALVDPLLVLRRDELGEQPERDELDADDDEQDAEREERALPDALAPEPDRPSGRGG